MTLRSLRPNEPLDNASDVASLHAALLEIDDWDFDFGFLFDTDPAPEPKPQPSDSRPRVLSAGITPKPQAAAPYTGRNRRKLEIQTLREQSLELQKQLDKAARAAEEAARIRASPGGVESTQIAAAWEQIAATQRAQRASLEQENRQIRESIATQAKIARQLFSTSRRARVPPGLLPMAPIAVHDVEWYRLSVSDHLAQLDELRAAMPAIFGRPCFTSGRREFQEVQILGDPVNMPIVQSDIAVVLPFEMDQVADALWHHTVRMCSLEPVYQLKDIDVRPSSLVSLFEGIASTMGFTMHGQIATRRYTSHGSCEIVSKIDSDVLSPAGVTFPFSGEGWLRCTPIHNGVPRTHEDGVTSPLTQVHWHRRIGVTLVTTSTVGVQLTPDMVAARVRETLTWNLQSVENRLLGQRRRRSWGLARSRSLDQAVEECL